MGSVGGGEMMDYITPQLFPGALSDTAARVLQTISRLGVWMPSPADLNHDQLRALLFLRNAGYIEYAAYGGYKVRTNVYTVATPQPAIEKISLAPKVALVYYRDGRKVTHREAARISELRAQVQNWHGERLGRHSDFVVYTRKVS